MSMGIDFTLWSKLLISFLIVMSFSEENIIKHGINIITNDANVNNTCVQVFQSELNNAFPNETLSISVASLNIKVATNQNSNSNNNVLPNNIIILIIIQYWQLL